ncbi:uncharacterized protein LOC127809807 isoform X2 [Diospyros lotus]|uniref:uncharacterized protein LOC127809807 isoform X2 n=1 Tax=Diospyros lotus TaxID=55363 RepID=UPI0022584427|nr:uncharacterized protein LOC127809807 isoform X2 [Diospyros lotus]
MASAACSCATTAAISYPSSEYFPSPAGFSPGARRRRRISVTSINATNSSRVSSSSSAMLFCSSSSTLFPHRGRGRGRETSFLSMPTSFLPLSIFVVSSSSAAAARNANSDTSSADGKSKGTDKKQLEGKEEEIVEEEDLPWIQEKALDLVEFTGSVTQAIPGPRVGRSSLPWILAIPLAYVGITFFIAVVKTLRKFNSPKHIRRKLVSKNAMLCKSIDEVFEEGRGGVQQSALKGLMQKTDFSMEEIFRKYIRYALNEKPFNPDLVANLIELRKASSLDESQVAEILNEISRRIVKDKGPVVMHMSGYSEKGFKRKLAVQALFGKVYYLSEVLLLICGPASRILFQG